MSPALTSFWIRCTYAWLACAIRSTCSAKHSGRTRCGGGSRCAGSPVVASASSAVRLLRLRLRRDEEEDAGGAGMAMTRAAMVGFKMDEAWKLGVAARIGS
jgi:hypothetical protein